MIKITKNAYLFNKLVDIQQQKYQAEEKLLTAIELWFIEHDIVVSAVLLDYNYVRIHSTDDNMCNFDMTKFCNEFNAKIDSYRHGWQWIDFTCHDNDSKVQMFWQFELHQKMEDD